mmetsp:Transcript_35724/g.65766  ORF Transcript_35724/g.65766 Transcript_35724/m.65766 type:complete len:229 (+) Transcript_35724:934-1620(+)
MEEKSRTMGSHGWTYPWTMEGGKSKASRIEQERASTSDPIVSFLMPFAPPPPLLIIAIGGEPNVNALNTFSFTKSAPLFSAMSINISTLKLPPMLCPFSTTLWFGPTRSTYSMSSLYNLRATERRPAWTRTEEVGPPRGTDDADVMRMRRRSRLTSSSEASKPRTVMVRTMIGVRCSASPTLSGASATSSRKSSSYPIESVTIHATSPVVPRATIECPAACASSTVFS